MGSVLEDTIKWVVSLGYTIIYVGSVLGDTIKWGVPYIVVSVQ